RKRVPKYCDNFGIVLREFGQSGKVGALTVQRKFTCTLLMKAQCTAKPKLFKEGKTDYLRFHYEEWQQRLGIEPHETFMLYDLLLTLSYNNQHFTIHHFNSFL
ncbi:hypothetical protein Ocin01_17588, partial [Orchesella cincta]